MERFRSEQFGAHCQTRAEGRKQEPNVSAFAGCACRFENQS